MLNQLLPPTLDNTYRGQRAAIWFLWPPLLMKTAIALGVIFNGRNAAQTADGIPLSEFGAAGAQTIIAMFAIWGLAQLTLLAVGWVVLFRYRAALAAYVLLLTFEHVARRVIFVLLPVPRTGTPPGSFINLGILVFMVIALTLSLVKRTEAKAAVIAQ